MKSAKKSFKDHEKYKDELTQIYKRFVRTGEMQEGVDLSFLDGAIFKFHWVNLTSINYLLIFIYMKI